VALGAGVQAGIEMGLDMPAVLVDITPYTFGTSVVGELDGRPYAHQFVPLIRRNAKLPATRTEAFYTLHEKQEFAEIKVYQGEDPDALQNVEIGTFLFEGLNRQRGARDRGLLFTYHLDLDGILSVHAVERATGREIRGVIEQAIGRSSEEALSASRERITARWGAEAEPGEADAAEQADAPELPPAIRDTLMRAESALATAPDEDKKEIVDLMEDLRDAVKDGATERAAGAKRDLDEILFYLE
jgi:molecular chaperone DnaK (HSP70)